MSFWVWGSIGIYDQHQGNLKIIKRRFLLCTFVLCFAKCCLVLLLSVAFAKCSVQTLTSLDWQQPKTFSVCWEILLPVCSDSYTTFGRKTDLLLNLKLPSERLKSCHIANNRGNNTMINKRDVKEKGLIYQMVKIKSLSKERSFQNRHWLL